MTLPHNGDQWSGGAHALWAVSWGHTRPDCVRFVLASRGFCRGNAPSSPAPVAMLVALAVLHWFDAAGGDGGPRDRPLVNALSPLWLPFLLLAVFRPSTHPSAM